MERECQRTPLRPPPNRRRRRCRPHRLPRRRLRTRLPQPELAGGTRLVPEEPVAFDDDGAALREGVEGLAHPRAGHGLQRLPGLRPAARVRAVRLEEEAQQRHPFSLAPPRLSSPVLSARSAGDHRAGDHRAAEHRVGNRLLGRVRARRERGGVGRGGTRGRGAARQDTVRVQRQELPKRAVLRLDPGVERGERGPEPAAEHLLPLLKVVRRAAVAARRSLGDALCVGAEQRHRPPHRPLLSLGRNLVVEAARRLGEGGVGASRDQRLLRLIDRPAARSQSSHARGSRRAGEKVQLLHRFPPPGPQPQQRVDLLLLRGPLAARRRRA
mmetsp:Transcript_23639/g.77797  ORF Transcript_23639/g.77797 Transcript_23639/m.77797 type:complete len:327 (-) Transcript_23639:284-1264(-)